MKKRYSSKLLCGALAALGFFALLPAFLSAPARADADQNPVVVELFTSQGCSSCPPADAYLSELASRPDILALSMHVDYWNGLGWRDPFSSTEVTERQRAYARTLGGRYVYTPQMVINGRVHAVGSDRAKVAGLIAAPRPDRAYAPSLALLDGRGGELEIALGKASFVGRATVWLVGFDNRHATRVGSGENSDRTLAYSNVVRSIRAVGQWSGRSSVLKVDIGPERAAKYDNVAVIVQAGGTGPIITAARRGRAVIRKTFFRTRRILSGDAGGVPPRGAMLKKYQAPRDRR